MGRFGKGHHWTDVCVIVISPEHTLHIFWLPFWRAKLCYPETFSYKFFNAFDVKKLISPSQYLSGIVVFKGRKCAWNLKRKTNCVGSGLKYNYMDWHVAWWSKASVGNLCVLSVKLFISMVNALWSYQKYLMQRLLEHPGRDPRGNNWDKSKSALLFHP